MKRFVTVVAAVATLSGCASAPQPVSVSTAVDSAQWVESTLAGMTLEQRVAQMLFVGVSGAFSGLAQAEFADVAALVADPGVGGVVIDVASPTDAAVRLNALQSGVHVPLLAAASPAWLSASAGHDQADDVGLSEFPFPLGLAATGLPSLADTAGRIAAREARAIGVHWLLGPPADLSTRADNPFVNLRSFGSDAAQAGEFVAAFVRGARRGGALTAVAHFPGYGEIGPESRVMLPRLLLDSRALAARELMPFQAAIAAGAPAVMLGHVAVPAFGSDRALPVSLAPGAATYLRDQLGFDGLIITDALDIEALAVLPGINAGELAVRAVEAGADVLLLPPDPRRAHRAIVEAVQTGRIPPARLEASVRRILAAKAGAGLHLQTLVAPGSVASVVDAPEHAGAANLIAERAITLAHDRGNVVPLDPRTVTRIQVVAFAAPGAMNVAAPLHASLDSIYGAGVEIVQLNETRDGAAFDQAVAAAADADAIVFATFLSATPQRSANLPESAVRLAAALRATGRPMIVVGFGDPHGPARLDTDALMLAWQPHAASAQHAVARALAGLSAIGGRLPVALAAAPLGAGESRAARPYTLSDAQPWQVGMDSALATRVERMVETAIIGGAAPGAAVAIGRHGRLALLDGYGRLDWRDGFGAVDETTIYDLASLTKVLATTTAVMLLVDDGRLDLDAPISRYLPEWSSRPERRSVTVRNLLLHDSGLPAWAALHAEADTRAEYRARIAGLRLQSVPGEKTTYSDLGFILLGLIVEEISGEQLDAFLAHRVFEPMGLRDTGFNPLAWPVRSGADDESALLTRIAPTEQSQSAPGGFIHGVVHDENARGLGGVSGHAGLFSTARDLAALVQMLMNDGFYGGRRYIEPETVQAFTRRFGTLSTRALGWDTPGQSTSAGEYFTASSFGHTGFTGTSIWADRERDVFVILLTNRVNPSRENQRHNALRRALANAVQQAITDMPVPPRDGR